MEPLNFGQWMNDVWRTALLAAMIPDDFHLDENMEWTLKQSHLWIEQSFMPTHVNHRQT